MSQLDAFDWNVLMFFPCDKIRIFDEDDVWVVSSVIFDIGHSTIQPPRTTHGEILGREGARFTPREIKLPSVSKQNKEL